MPLESPITIKLESDKILFSFHKSGRKKNNGFGQEIKKGTRVKAESSVRTITTVNNGATQTMCG